VLIQIGPSRSAGMRSPISRASCSAGAISFWLLHKDRLWQGTPGNKPPLTALQMDDVVLWMTLGIVRAGGSATSCSTASSIFPMNIWANPLQMLMVWEGGMSFHGGLNRVLLALALYCRSNKLSFLRVGDLIGAATPIGLFFGRLANFIKPELWAGRAMCLGHVFCNDRIKLDP